MDSMRLKTYRQLYRILRGNDLFAEIRKLSPGEILRRWVHDHVKNAGCPRVATNVTKGLSAPGSQTAIRDQSHRSCSIFAPLPLTNLCQRAEGMLQRPRRSTVGSSPAHDDGSILYPEQDELVPDGEHHNSDLSIMCRGSSQAGRHSHSDRRRITLFKQFESARWVKADADGCKREEFA
jgi:hypothetical protein